MKNYLLTVLENCTDKQFGQDAIEWAIFHGHVKLTYNLDADVRAIMGAVCHRCHQVVELDATLCLKPHIGAANPCYSSHTRDYQHTYDRLIEAYRRAEAEHGAALLDIYHASGLMEEILRPVPILPPLRVAESAEQWGEGRGEVKPELVAA